MGVGIRGLIPIQSLFPAPAPMFSDTWWGAARSSKRKFSTRLAS